MNWLNSIDIQLFQLINNAGYQQMDFPMILISSKWIWIPLYLYLLYLLIWLSLKNMFNVMIFKKEN